MPPVTVTCLASSPEGAGGATTEPSSIENLLPWHEQLIEPSSTLVTGQLSCVQIAENARKSPSVGWVTTTFASS